MKIHKAINFLLIVVLLLTGFSASPNLTNAQGPVEESLDQMNLFSVLANLGVESLGITQIEGNLGIAAEGAEALGDWQVGGEKHFGPGSLAGSALEEAKSLDAELAEKACDTTVVSGENALTTVVLTPGVTCFEGETVFLNELMLEHQQEDEAQYIIRAAGDIIFSEDSNVSLAEPNQVESVYWQIAGSLIAGERSQLQGTFLVTSGIEIGLQTDVTGRLISFEGSVLTNESKVHFKADLPTTEPPIEPTKVPIPEPTLEPTPEPTEEPTPEPTEEPTPEPTEEPSPEPTEEPTPEPTEEPTPEPTEEPTPEPTEEPTPEPTEEPTLEPTEEPTPEPTEEPIPNPTQTQETPGNANDEILLVPVINDHLDAVKDEYIVVYKTEFAVADEINTNSLNFESLGIVIDTVYETVLNGFSVKMTKSALLELRKNPKIDYIEPNYYVIGNQTGVVDEANNFPQSVQYGPVWGLDRIDQRNLPLDNTYTYDNTASGVHVYVIDSGILSTHQEFTGRVGLGFDSVGDGWGVSDCDGHGTHVSGTIGGTTYGVAKGVTIHPIRVLDCFGSGTLSGILSGMDWVARNKQTPAVANMSIGIDGGGTSPAWDAATEALINAGVTTVIAAGNSSINACNSSPARVDRAITVGATDSADWRAYFSNYGPCVDIFAPGFGITSAGILSNSDTKEMSGTSMAAPHVTGVAALFLKTNPTATPTQVSQFIIQYATEGKVSDPGAGSPNLLLHSRFLAPIPISPSGIIYQKYPTFTWTKVANATSYNVQVWTANGRVTNKIVYPSACGSTQCSAVIGPLPYVSQYFWRVNAYIGGWQPWSVDRYFTRFNPIPTLVWPSGTVTAINPYFQWKPIPGATNYNIQLYNSTGLYINKTVTSSACNSTICSTLLSNSLPLGSYYWRVKVYIDGSWDVFSAFKYFTRTMPPPTPITPSGTIYQKYPTFTWTKIANATSYNVQVWTANGRVTNKIVYPSACGATQCSAVIGPLPYVSQYFWRVNAYVGGWGPWSADKYFTRLDPIPTLVWPSGAITIPNPYFQWRPLAGATNYNIELYNSYGLYSTVTVTSGNCNSAVCSIKLTVFLPLGNYYWRVKSFTEGSWNSFSPFMYFSRPGFQNPGFEQGPVGWGQFSMEGYELIYEADFAHGGSWLAWLGGVENEFSNIYQTIDISGAAPYLHFWYYAESVDNCGFDSFKVNVNGTTIITMDLCELNNTNGWIEIVLNLSGYAGSDKTVEFIVDTDSSLISSVFLDDISLTAYAKTSRIIPSQVDTIQGEVRKTR